MPRNPVLSFQANSRSARSSWLQRLPHSIVTAWHSGAPAPRGRVFWRLVVKRSHYTLATMFMALAFTRPAVADQLDDLAQEFWAWRAAEQPFSGDDIERIERPAGWTPDWSAVAIARRRQEAARFEERWKRLEGEMDGAPVPRQVDYRLLGSALARVRWELDITR